MGKNILPNDSGKAPSWEKFKIYYASYGKKVGRRRGLRQKRRKKKEDNGESHFAELFGYFKATNKGMNREEREIRGKGSGQTTASKS